MVAGSRRMGVNGVGFVSVIVVVVDREGGEFGCYQECTGLKEQF